MTEETDAWVEDQHSLHYAEYDPSDQDADGGTHRSPDNTATSRQSGRTETADG